MEEKTIDQGTSRLTNKFIGYAFVGLLFGSNVLNSYINTQYHNSIKIEENNEANKRRLTHAIEKQDFKIEIKDLTRELKNCNNAR